MLTWYQSSSIGSSLNLFTQYIFLPLMISIITLSINYWYLLLFFSKFNKKYCSFFMHIGNFVYAFFTPNTFHHSMTSSAEHLLQANHWGNVIILIAFTFMCIWSANYFERKLQAFEFISYKLCISSRIWYTIRGKCWSIIFTSQGNNQGNDC
jgi:hypothetical protein